MSLSSIIRFISRHVDHLRAVPLTLEVFRVSHQVTGHPPPDELTLVCMLPMVAESPPDAAAAAAAAAVVRRGVEASTDGKESNGGVSLARLSLPERMELAAYALQLAPPQPFNSQQQQQQQQQQQEPQQLSSSSLVPFGGATAAVPLAQLLPPSFQHNPSIINSEAVRVMMRKTVDMVAKQRTAASLSQGALSAAAARVGGGANTSAAISSSSSSSSSLRVPNPLPTPSSSSSSPPFSAASASSGSSGSVLLDYVRRDYSFTFNNEPSSSSTSCSPSLAGGGGKGSGGGDKGLSLSVLAPQPLFSPSLSPWAAVCRKVYGGGKAERIGLRDGDVIKSANGLKLLREPGELAVK
jgi:hypothetical protein